MPGLYDSYQLANSTQVPAYVGSTMPEMVKVADVMQHRYDDAELGMEGLGTMMKDAQVLDKDKGVFAQRLKDYQDQLSQWAQRPDLENVQKDVAKAGRNFANEYKNYASRLSQAYEYKKQLDDQVDKGHIDQGTADDLLNMSHDYDQGIKYDAATGRYDNVRFTGITPSKTVDRIELAKKAAGDIAASRHATLVSAPDGSGNYWMRIGNSYEAIKPAQIESAMKAAMANNLDLKADMQQRQRIAAWKARGAKFADIKDEKLKATIQDAADKAGVSPDAYTDAYMRQKAAKDEYDDDYKNIMQLASKYAYTKVDTQNTIDQETIQGKHQGEQDLFAISTTNPGPGTNIQSVSDFTDLKGSTQVAHDQAMQNYSDWMDQQNRVGKLSSGAGGKVYRINPDGTKTDVTDKANELRSAISTKRDELSQHEIVDKAARLASGYNPDDPANKKVLGKAADEYAWSQLNAAMNAGGGQGGGSWANLTEDKKKDMLNLYRNTYIKENSPGYGKYLEELQKRMNPAATSGTMLMIGNENTKKLWSENLTALSSQLGLKNSSLSFKIGSGPDQGKDITADQYDGIKGKVDVVGFDTDENGKPVLKLRAFANVKGKKTEGENLVLNLGNTNVDDWLQQQVKNHKLDAGQYDQYRRVGWLKGRLNNPYKTTTVKIPGTETDASIRSEDGKWVVSLPTKEGQSEQTADSYEGVLSILQQAGSNYK
jgi:hypothetical protein